MYKLALVGVAALASGVAADAATYEPFDYVTDSALAGASGGSGFGGAWGTSGTDANETQIVLSGSLPGSSLPASGGLLQLASSGANHNSNATRLVYGSNQSTGTFYISALMRPDGGNSTSFGYLQLNDINSNTPIRIGYTVGSQWYVRSPVNGNAHSNSALNVVNGTATFLLAKLDLDANTAELWVNPSSASLAAPDASVTIGTSTSARFDRISLRAGSGSNTGTTMASFDEIRIGTTLADVILVPEPAALAVLAGATCLLGLRKRKA